MVMLGTRLDVADNTGAKLIECFHVEGGHYRRYASVGDTIIASVKMSLPESAVKKGSVVRAVVVRTTKELRRKDGTYLRFDRNSAVLIDKQGEPMGTRIFGPVARELRDKNFMKIVSLAPEAF